MLLTFTDTCHFQKLHEDSKTTEFDFHWNTSPTSVVCAFPYIIAFTSDCMEIRLLVNGNLVHTVAMADLELITSKRDIYFATTAPEFIPKDFRMKGIESDQDHDPQRSSPSNNQFSNERILEIKHKLEAAHCDQQQLDDIVSLHINSEDDLNKFLPLPMTGSVSTDHCIQRARSLQKPKSYFDESKRAISKSNSCGDSYSANERVRSIGEPSVPPNSPKTGGAGDSPISPTKRYYAKPSFSRGQFTGNYNENGSPEKVKPLRIFRIPLANLTGTHSHYHTHSSQPKSKKLQSNKIDEDHLEAEEATTIADSAPTKICDKEVKINGMAFNCAIDPLYSSL